ncbi:MAG: YIP1 family protein, partial [Asticcacaulis sp.]|nr:YIP1 family protein [Asticcacaulis sp.]
MNDSTPSDPTPTIAPKAQGLIARVQAILLRPSPTWDVIATETSDVKSLYTGYIIPLAAIGPLAAIIGVTVFTLGFGLIPGLIAGIWQFVGSLIVVYVLALITDALAPSFDGQKNFNQAFKLAGYSMTAGWAAGIILILPFLAPIAGLIGLYNFYLFYRGAPRLMKTPAEKSLGFTAVVGVIALLVMLIVVWTSALITGAGMLGAGVMGAGMFGGLHRGAMVSNDGKVNGTIRVNGVTVDLGKAQQAADQMAAEASAQQNGTTTVKVADPQVLLALMPASYMGVTRSDDSTSSGGAGGINAANAEGHYVINDNTVQLQISDLGSVSGLGAFATAMNVNSSSSSATGYSKIVTQNGQMITEEYDRDSKYGKYGIVRNGRISVEASGTVDSIDTLKNLVNSIDAGQL